MSGALKETGDRALAHLDAYLAGQPPPEAEPDDEAGEEPDAGAGRWK